MVSPLTRLVSMPTLDRRRVLDMGIDGSSSSAAAARMLGMHPHRRPQVTPTARLVQPHADHGQHARVPRGELERLKVIKRLVDDGGINLAGVQRLLSIAEVVQRMRAAHAR